MALRGVTVLEIAGLAPVPFCGMILADFGANVIRIDRPRVSSMPDTLSRGKRSIAVDFKKPEGKNVIKRLTKKADVLIEPFRPGVMEKLGLGPGVLCDENPRLIYGRISGYGQSDGPNKLLAGHDINYLATSGILSRIKRDGETPLPPLNLLADMAGGGLTCAFGIVSALYERERSGKGQVIDTNMTAGSAYVSSFVYTQRHTFFGNEPGKNLLDSGAPFYGCYETKDGKYVAIGALEPHFYKELLKGLQIDENKIPQQLDVNNWCEIRDAIKNSVKKKTRDELQKIFSGTDACVSPVLTLDEAPLDAHNKKTDLFFKSDDGNFYPYPSPKLSRTPGEPDKGHQPQKSSHTTEVLLEYGFSNKEIKQLQKSGAIEDSNTRNHISKL